MRSCCEGSPRLSLLTGDVVVERQRSVAGGDCSSLAQRFASGGEMRSRGAGSSKRLGLRGCLSARAETRHQGSDSPAWRRGLVRDTGRSRKASL